MLRVTRYMLRVTCLRVEMNIHTSNFGVRNLFLYYLSNLLFVPRAFRCTRVSLRDTIFRDGALPGAGVAGRGLSGALWVARSVLAPCSLWHCGLQHSNTLTADPS